MTTIYTITTAKGGFCGTLREVCEWQAEHQGAGAEIDGVDVDAVDFDPDDLDSTVSAVEAALAKFVRTDSDAWRRIDGREIDTDTVSGRAQIWAAYCWHQSVPEALRCGIADDWEGFARSAFGGLPWADALTDLALADAVDALVKCLRQYVADEVVETIPGAKIEAVDPSAIVPTSADVYADGSVYAHYADEPSAWYSDDDWHRYYRPAPIAITITLDARADLSAAGEDRDEADDYAAAYEEAAAWLSSQCGLDITVLESRYFDDAERDTSTGIEQDVWQACHDLVVRAVDGTWTSSESQSVADGIRRAMRAVEV